MTIAEEPPQHVASLGIHLLRQCNKICLTRNGAVPVNLAFGDSVIRIERTIQPGSFNVISRRRHHCESPTLSLGMSAMLHLQPRIMRLVLLIWICRDRHNQQTHLTFWMPLTAGNATFPPHVPQITNVQVSAKTYSCAFVVCLVFPCLCVSSMRMHDTVPSHPSHNRVPLV